jgi:fatty-acyl-CoA synthase
MGIREARQVDANIADCWESIALAIPDATCIVQGEKRRAWGDMESRASRLANALRGAGLEPDSKVGLLLFNCPEYLEATFASFKVRAAPINVNPRYVDDELVYILDNSDSEALIFHGSLGDRVARVLDRLPKLRIVIQVLDGAPQYPWAKEYEAAIASETSMDRIRRSGEDAYILYTGGTTGYPKGVIWLQGDVVDGSRRGYQQTNVPAPDSPQGFGESARALVESGNAPVQLAAPPLTHGAGSLGAVHTLLMGGTVVLLNERSFNPDELWTAVERERVTRISIVGDAFARPMVEALDEAAAKGRPYDLSSLRGIGNSGAMLSAGAKRSLLEHHDMMVTDGLGASEATGYGSQVATRGNVPPTGRFQLGKRVRVFGEDGQEVVPGSGQVGFLAVSNRRGAVGYYKDPVKTAQLFRVIDGQRYTVTGDHATVQLDGTIEFVGRGSQCINTGGEKVFPEEVEQAIKEHPSVVDCIVVGVPSERWGEAVSAVVSLIAPESADADEIKATVRQRLSGYKVPKEVVFVDQVVRNPVGKADYAWAKETAAQALKDSGHGEAAVNPHR